MLYCDVIGMGWCDVIVIGGCETSGDDAETAAANMACKQQLIVYYIADDVSNFLVFMFFIMIP